MTFDEHPFQVTTSIGVVSYPMHATTTDVLLQAADTALYTAKHAGRNRVSGPPARMTPARHLPHERQAAAR